MEKLEQRIKEINQELTKLVDFKESLESQLKALDIQITQKVGAVNELKAILQSLSESQELPPKDQNPLGK